MFSSKELIVTIRCLAYNHEPYIRQCLEGFVMQKTNFRFEAIVHDDASTDGTAAIILEYAEKYPDIIKPIIETENQYSKRDGSLRRIMDAHMHGKYIAICEGDDYWTDPYKLQKQVDFLEANPEYSMCFANAIEHWEDGSKEDRCFSNVADRDYTGAEIYEKWIIPTASVLFRKEIILSQRYNEVKSNKNFIFGDIVLFLTCAEFGKLRGMKDVVSVYRRHDNGATGKKNLTLDYFLKYAYHQRELRIVFGRGDKQILKVSNKYACFHLVDVFFKFLQKGQINFKFIKDSFKISFFLTFKFLLRKIVKHLF